MSLHISQLIIFLDLEFVKLVTYLLFSNQALFFTHYIILVIIKNNTSHLHKQIYIHNKSDSENINCGDIINMSRKKTGRDGLLSWIQTRTKGYKSVSIENFTDSWVDGMHLYSHISRH